MRVHVVSDVHGRADALAQAADGADALICLGDLLLFLDYADHGQGIFADLFGEQAASRYVELRTAKKFEEAREFSAGLFAALPEPAYLTYGNVDVPGVWARYTRPGHRVLDGETVEIGGLTFGFV